MNPTCPIDNKDDAIQKVSAVVASGQSSGTFSGPTGGIVSYDGKTGSVAGHTTLSGSSTSQLAFLLAPPPEPKEESYSCLLTILAWFMIIAGGAELYVYVANFLLSGEFHGVLGGIFGFILFIIFVVMVWGGLKILKARKVHINKEREKLQQNIPIWESAMRKWDRLYYCHKHDIAFDPENGETCPSNSLKEFLYK
jgi:hypothetical protein